MKRVAIVGHEAAKFLPENEALAREIIRSLLHGAYCVVSGACHLGGVDVWAEEEAKALGLECSIHPPRKLSWELGYKPRNIRIARDCSEAHCIVVRELPPSYQGMRFESCYHCGQARPAHIKSGGCWTCKYAEKLGKSALWHIVG